MSEMVERVGRALAESAYQDIDADVFHYNYEQRGASYDAIARIVLKAMRDPTLEMRRVCSFTAAEIDYPAMIDAALKD